MAKDYDNTDTGALFKNREKETDRHPDYQGAINVGGQEYWLSAWIKTSKAGDKYMSLAVKAKGASIKTPAADKKAEDRAFTDDSIPF